MKRFLLVLIVLALLIIAAGTLPPDFETPIGSVNTLLNWGQALKTLGELEEVGSTAADELTSGPKETDIVSKMSEIIATVEDVSRWETAEMNITGLTTIDSRKSSIEAPDDSHKIVKEAAEFAEGLVNLFSENTRIVEAKATVAAAVDISPILNQQSGAIEEYPSENLVIFHLPHAVLTHVELTEVIAEPEHQGILVRLTEGDFSSIDPVTVTELNKQARIQARGRGLLTKAEDEVGEQLQKLFEPMGLEVRVVFDFEQF